MRTAATCHIMRTAPQTRQGRFAGCDGLQRDGSHTPITPSAVRRRKGTATAPAAALRPRARGPAQWGGP